jgi:hypothetical protein
MEKITIEPIQWQAPEYTHKNQSVDFLWTIGLVALVGCIIAIWKHNYVFGIFILISGACLIFFTLRKPEYITFSIDNDGIKMGKDNHPWKSIKSFNIKENTPYNKLIIETTKKFLPIYTLPIPSVITEEVRISLTKLIPNSEINESPSMLFMEKLGF